MSVLERLFESHLRDRGVGGYAREYRFDLRGAGASPDAFNAHAPCGAGRPQADRRRRRAVSDPLIYQGVSQP
jgi:hypothetical protein